MGNNKFKRKPLEITFPEGHDLHGFEARVRRARVEHIEAVRGMDTSSEADVERALRNIAGAFGPALISWNYVDEDDREVPATTEGFLSIDLEAQMLIITAWVDLTDGISPDLGKESDSGPASPVPNSIPVTGTPGLSDALANLHALNASSRSLNASEATPTAA